MSISYDDVGTDLRRIEISGRMDVPGTESIAPKLMELAAASRRAVVVDLSALGFLASIGVGALIACAKEVKRRGGKMALVVDSRSIVKTSIEATGVDELIPVFHDAADAEKAALA